MSEDLLRRVSKRAQALERLLELSSPEIYAFIVELRGHIKDARDIPLPGRLPCPNCGKLHIDRGEYAMKAHHTHACQYCGMVWRPFVEHTVGVEFLPGFKDMPAPYGNNAPCESVLCSCPNKIPVLRNTWGTLTNDGTLHEVLQPCSPYPPAPYTRSRQP